MSDESMSMEVDMALGNHDYAAFQLSIECAKNVYLTNKDQRATYYLGAICCLMPEITEDIVDVVRSMGRKVRTVSSLSAAAENGFILPPKGVEPRKAMLLFSYLVIMLYKTESEVNFREFYEEFYEEYLEETGFTLGEGAGAAVFNDVEHSSYFRTTYGQNHMIRNTKDSDFLGSVCTDLASFLRPGDMAGFLFTYVTLLDSPVLQVPKLADEVNNFRKACNAVKFSPHQYYMISKNHETNYIFHSSNFPTLTAVAQKIRKNAEISEVDYYVAMHKNQSSHKSAKL